ncbi:5-epiaristolochene 1,3-dihydroxylase-like [Panicum miliaceum]|uniref:5-epiaristolochene 1,3-dihydroxylase-like n=1 Tax=Panicum miliaceum TaxID=4540 RepID=A0A3L6TR73_PANMI|nr:5-epiaristolochene 1,3-dihydroxylase-like [Panicum miliaceum]
MVHDISSRTISRLSFGEVRDDMPVFQDAIKRVIGLSSGSNVSDLFPQLREVLGEASGKKRKLQEIHRTFDRILVDIIEKRRRERSAMVATGKEVVDENVVDVMLTLQQQDDNAWGFPVTDNTIKVVVLDMFTGGTRTSGSLTEWAMSEIVRNPRLMRKLQDEIRRAFRGKETITETDLRNNDLKYLKLAMKEAIRLHPAAPPLVPQESITTAELGGYVVPGGSRIVVNAWAISRDPRYWKDPEEFRPERFAEDGAPDFHGSTTSSRRSRASRRMCPGYNYGLAGMQLALLQLMYHFDWRLPPGLTRPVNGPTQSIPRARPNIEPAQPSAGTSHLPTPQPPRGTLTGGVRLSAFPSFSRRSRLALLCFLPRPAPHPPAAPASPPPLHAKNPNGLACSAHLSVGRYAPAVVHDHPSAPQKP